MSTHAPDQTDAVPFAWRDVAAHTWAMWSCASLLTLVAALAVFVIPDPAGTLRTSRLDGVGFAIMVAAPTALFLVGAMWVLAPMTWAIGRALRNVPNPLVHIAVFAGVGAALSLATLFVWPYPLAGVAAALGSAVSAGFGRWWAFRARGRRAAVGADATPAPV
ncbi:hypothetical protein AB3M83_01795 [Microbacterium sp. 179-B 1A2 NHS]|uniref:hypothetical protein n=1 Tax=Microbacterium sp. 179-B 1A2 NHS TaxID=3142383 RepID=UPI0039A2A311